MQNIDALRDRVGATTEKLTQVQTERQDRTRSLVDILAQLENKYSTQQSELAYYRERLIPLEATNGQLASLIENLLDLIETGFGEEGLRPLRQASEMAASLLSAETGQTDTTEQSAEIDLVDEVVDAPVLNGAEQEAASVAEAIVAAEALEQAVAEDPAFDEPESIELSPAPEIVPETDFESGIRFEDVRDAVLDLENREEEFDGNGHWTDVVFEAAGIPVPANTSEAEEADPVSEEDEHLVEGAAADIQALLKRVEALASEMDAGDAAIGNTPKTEMEVALEPLLKAGNGG